MTTRRGRPPRNGPDDADDLERLVSSAGPDDVVQVYRRDPATSKPVYLEQLETAQLRAEGMREFVSRRYGGGDYKARLRNRTTGAYGMARAFAIAGSPKAFTRDAPADGVGASASSSSAGSSAASIAERIALALAIPFATAAGGFLAKKLLERPQVDPMLQELFRALERSRKADGAIDSLELLKLLQQAELRGQQLGERIGELAAAAEREPATDNGEGWTNALLNAITPLEGIANRYFDLEEKKLTRGDRGRPTLALVPGTAATPAAAASSSDSSSSSSSGEIDPADPLVQVLGQIPIPARRFLLSAANNGDDPEAYVPLILTKLPDATYRRLVSLIDRPDFLETMILVVPKWGERRQWFAQLCDGLRRVIHTATAAAAESSLSSSSSSSPSAGEPAAGEATA